MRLGFRSKIGDARPGSASWASRTRLMSTLTAKRLASHASKLPLVVDVSNHLRSENVLVLHCHADFRPGQAERRERGSYLGPNPSISSVGVFDQIFLEISEGHRFEEVVADAAAR